MLLISIKKIPSPTQNLIILVPTQELRALGANGFPSKLIIALFSDEVGAHVLKDVGLISISMVCRKCGSQMSWCVDTSGRDGYRWQCLRAVSASACRASTSITHGTWFQLSNMNYTEFLLLTYDIVRRVAAHTFQQEHHFGTTTITDLAKLCSEVMSPATGKICDITYYIAINPLRSIYVTLR